jgi:hypothetical protein
MSRSQLLQLRQLAAQCASCTLQQYLRTVCISRADWYCTCLMFTRLLVYAYITATAFCTVVMYVSG